MTIKDYQMKTFIDEELKVFSNLDNVRSIPSLIDGFKDSQRKAVYGLIKHGTSEIKNAQLGGFCSLISHYNHGEVSMCDTIVGLAQNFPGSNNVNLFEPIGQYGSILSPEAAAHRYIYTKQSVNLRKYLRKDDDAILVHREEEGSVLEPVNYLPIMPMWIVNGSVGIGTGHSVKILSRDPKKVASLITKLVNGTTVQQKTIDSHLIPYFRGWGGTVIPLENNSYEIRGHLEVVNTTTIRIQHLPIGYDVDKYKTILIKLMDDGIVKDFDNNSTESGFDFIINVPREVTKRDPESLHNLFKLSIKVTENVTLWGVDGKLKRYDSVYDALKEFVAYRAEKYMVRKQKQLDSINEELGWLTSKHAFIIHWNTKVVDPHKKTKDQLETEFSGVIDMQYFDRLLSLQIRSLTMEVLDDLESQIKSLREQYEELDSTPPSEIYLGELREV